MCRKGEWIGFQLTGNEARGSLGLEGGNNNIKYSKTVEFSIVTVYYIIYLIGLKKFILFL